MTKTIETITQELKDIQKETYLEPRCPELPIKLPIGSYHYACDIRDSYVKKETQYLKAVISNETEYSADARRFATQKLVKRAMIPLLSYHYDPHRETVPREDLLEILEDNKLFPEIAKLKMKFAMNDLSTSEQDREGIEALRKAGNIIDAKRFERQIHGNLSREANEYLLHKLREYV